MRKYETLDHLVKKNNGFLKTSDAVLAGISRTYFIQYVKNEKLERVAQGLYVSQDAWVDGMFIIQTRYPNAIFSHETALYLLELASREPTRYSLTMKAGTNPNRLANQNVKVYTIQESLLNIGLTRALSPAGHELRVYNPERTICDLLRSRKNIEIQEFQTGLREYVRKKDKDLLLLYKYAKLFSVEKTLRQYMDVLL
jgi:hypothetical protein